eukprot:521598_1
MATTTPAPIGGLIKEFVLNSHTNPSPAPTSATADTTQDLVSTAISQDVTPSPHMKITCERTYDLDLEGSVETQFTDTTESIILYGAYGKYGGGLALDDHIVGGGHASPIDVLLIQNNPDTYWCTSVIDCAGTTNDCCVALSTYTPT